jgi:hypothetical protein
MKIYACTFQLSVLLTVLPTALPGQDFTWTTNAGEITITGYSGAGGNVVIPDTMTGLPVTAIGPQAFYNAPSLTGLVVPDSVIRIGSAAFLACTNLTSVTLGNGVTTLEWLAFRFCTSLTNVALGNSLTTIGEGVFRECTRLPRVTLPDSVTNLGMAAFQDCTRLGNVDIPDNVTAIGNSAFQSCTSLTHVSLGDSVGSLGQSAFAECGSLNQVVTSDSLTNIGNYAFDGCSSLTHLTLPKGVTTIGNFAFNACTSLTDLRFRGSAPAPGGNVFSEPNQPIIYYLPGTAGWGPSFADRPTALWLPQLQAAGVRTNVFGFHIAWASGMSVAVDAAPGPWDSPWLPLATNTLAGDSLYFSDPDWTDQSARLYRVRLP